METFIPLLESKIRNMTQYILSPKNDGTSILAGIYFYLGSKTPAKLGTADFYFTVEEKNEKKYSDCFVSPPKKSKGIH